MAAPTFIQETETSWAAAAVSSKTTASFNVLAGDILVALAGTEDNAADITSISGGSLTWTLRQKVAVADYCQAGAWTAVVDTDKSMTVTVTKNNATLRAFGVNVLTFRASDGVGASSKTNVLSGAPTLNLTTTQADSAIAVFNADWTAADGASRTWRSGAGTLTEQTYFRDSAHYTVYGGYHADADAIGVKAVGLSAPGSQRYSIVACEVKGTAVTTIEVDGALASQAAVIAGVSSININVTGALAAQSAIIAGVTQAKVNAAGVLAASSSVIAGVTQAKINAAGALSAASATLSGVTQSHINATGILLSAPATIAGVSDILLNFNGALLSSAAVIAGIYTAETDDITVVGDLIAQSASMSGAVDVIINFNGALVSQDAIILGAATVIFPLAFVGDLQAQRASISGTVTVTPLARREKPDMEVSRHFWEQHRWDFKVGRRG